MVRTTKGAAEKNPKTPGSDAGTAQTDQGDLQVKRNVELDDATWRQVEWMARFQSSTPSDVVRRAITAQYGQASPDSSPDSGERANPVLTTK